MALEASSVSWQHATLNLVRPQKRHVFAYSTACGSTHVTDLLTKKRVERALKGLMLGQGAAHSLQEDGLKHWNMSSLDLQSTQNHGLYTHNKGYVGHHQDSTLRIIERKPSFMRLFCLRGFRVPCGTQSRIAEAWQASHQSPSFLNFLL